MDLANTQGLVLMVGHILEYHLAIIELNRLIREGDIGKIQYIYSSRLNLGKLRTEENILWSFAPHDISVILGILGELPTHVASQGGQLPESSDCGHHAEYSGIPEWRESAYLCELATSF